MAEPGGRCVVIGGGLAGLAASVWLADAGERVTLLERRGSLGGRTHAIEIASIADVADNGQHIMVPGFVNLMRYLDTIGTRQHMRFEPIAARDRDGAQLVGNGIRNAGAFLVGRLPGCPRRDWPATFAAQARIVRQSLRQPADLDSISVREWFDRVGMPASAREASWDLLAIGVLNEKCELASAKAFADIIATFVRLARSQRLPVKFGYPAVDFDTLYVEWGPAPDPRAGRRGAPSGDRASGDGRERFGDRCAARRREPHRGGLGDLRSSGMGHRRLARRGSRARTDR